MASNQTTEAAIASPGSQLSDLSASQSTTNQVDSNQESTPSFSSPSITELPNPVLSDLNPDLFVSQFISPSASVAPASNPANWIGDRSTTDELEQLTSVSQLSDVRPTDWAYQALQSLVEKYGCIAGYPDSTFRGRNFLTRYEFAAGVNACLDRISELIAAGLADVATQDDLATLQRLQEEFAAELATLRGRVDALEARTAELEANQFSTTTKLSGRVIFFASAALDEDEAFDDQVIFSDRVRLNFDTSFTGSDRLRTRFQARNIPRFEGDSVGFRASGDSGNDFELDNLFYTFPIGDRLTVNIGANALEPSEVVDDVISRFEDNDTGAISALGRPPQYTQGTISSGAGINATLALIDTDEIGLSLSGGYIGSDAADPSPGEGLFNGDYSAVGQLTFSSDLVDAAFTYINSYSGSPFGTVSRIYNVSGPVIGNTYGGQVNFKLFDDTVEIGGGVAYTDVSGIGSRPDFDLWSYQATLGFPDLGGEGNLLGVLAAVAPYTRDLRPQTSDTSLLGELFYRYYVTDNIALTPSIILLTDPYNDNDNDATLIGTLRTTFSF